MVQHCTLMSTVNRTELHLMSHCVLCTRWRLKLRRWSAAGSTRGTWPPLWRSFSSVYQVLTVFQHHWWLIAEPQASTWMNWDCFLIAVLEMYSKLKEQLESKRYVALYSSLSSRHSSTLTVIYLEACLIWSHSQWPVQCYRSQWSAPLKTSGEDSRHCGNGW